MYSSIIQQTSYIFKHLSILRHDGDFDDSNLIYGPATPFIPGVTEPEPEIPLHDNEDVCRRTRSTNDEPHMPKTSTEGTISSLPRTTSEVSSRVAHNPSIQSITNVNMTQARDQIQSQDIFRHPSSMPQLKRYPTATAIRQNNIHSHPNTTVSNATNSLPTRTDNIPPNYVNFLTPQNSETVRLRSTVLNPKVPPHKEQPWRYGSSSQMNTVTSAQLPVLHAPYGNPRFPNTYNWNCYQANHFQRNQQQTSYNPLNQRYAQHHPSQGRGTQHHFSPMSQSNFGASQRFTASPILPPRSSTRTHEQCNPKIMALAKQLMNRMNLNPQDIKEFQEVQQKLETMWARNPNDIRLYLHRIMKNPQDNKWYIWYRYYYTIATEKSLGESESEKDLIRLCSKVAETLKAICTQHLETQNQNNVPRQPITAQTYNNDTVNRFQNRPQPQAYSASEAAHIRPNATQNNRYAQDQNYYPTVQRQQTTSSSNDMPKLPQPHPTLTFQNKKGPQSSTSSNTIEAHSSLSAWNSREVASSTISSCTRTMDTASPPAGYSASAHFDQLKNNKHEDNNGGVPSNIANKPSSVEKIIEPTSIISEHSNHPSIQGENVHGKKPNKTKSIHEAGPSNIPEQGSAHNETENNGSSKTLSSELKLSTSSHLDIPNNSNNSRDILPKVQDSAEINYESTEVKQKFVAIIRKKHHQPPPNFQKHNISTKLNDKNEQKSNSLHYENHTEPVLVSRTNTPTQIGIEPQKVATSNLPLSQITEQNHDTAVSKNKDELQNKTDCKLKEGGVENAKKSQMNTTLGNKESSLSVKERNSTMHLQKGKKYSYTNIFVVPKDFYFT